MSMEDLIETAIGIVGIVVMIAFCIFISFFVTVGIGYGIDYFCEHVENPPCSVCDCVEEYHSTFVSTDRHCTVNGIDVDCDTREPLGVDEDA